MASTLGVAIPRGFSVVRGLVMTARPWQWTKNFLVFLPLIFSLGERWTLADLNMFAGLAGRSTLTFLAFCAISSSVYFFNDIMDREHDRLHPRKRFRPIASNVVPISLANIVAVGLVAIGLIGSVIVGFEVALVALVYLIASFAYTTKVKHLVILDVIILSSGFIFRVVAGSMAIDVVTSPWLYITVGSGALFLVLGKRLGELKTAGDSAATQREVLGFYTPEILNQLITITATSTMMAYALYTFAAGNVPADKSMMLTIPFVVFGLFRYLFIMSKSVDSESPELLLIKDLPLLAAISLWGITALAVMAVAR
ncbi:MAG: decaprenyl-phosphate phosphoribosyltransferase [Chloroflexi bacterium]|nr:decaprenyl-phosphate phosphoribosyltransferase [Chloroflexota bacterium]